MKVFVLHAMLAGATVALVSCSASRQGAETAAADQSGAISGSASDLYSGLFKLPATQKQQLFANLGAMSFDKLYDHLHAQVANTPVTVDGVVYTDVLKRLESNKASILALGSHFKNLQEMWTAMGINPAAMSQKDVQSGLSGILSKQHSLGLVQRASGLDLCSAFEDGFGATSAALANSLNTSRTMAAEFGKDAVYPVRGAASLYAVTLGDMSNYFTTRSSDPQRGAIHNSIAYIDNCLTRNVDGSYSPNTGADAPRADMPRGPDAHDAGFFGP